MRSYGFLAVLALTLPLPAQTDPYFPKPSYFRKHFSNVSTHVELQPPVRLLLPQRVALPAFPPDIAWLFDGNTFWTWDDPLEMVRKALFIRSQHLGGAMIWSLDGDTTQGDLISALHLGLSF